MAVPLDNMGGGLTSEDASLPRPSSRPIEDKEAAPRASWVNRGSGLSSPGGVGESSPSLKTPGGLCCYSCRTSGLFPGLFKQKNVMPFDFLFCRGLSNIEARARVTECSPPSPQTTLQSSCTK